ncbi:MAG: bifunctional oligoribonuclease/PAP phosphatase NrnA, partial [Bacteroidaceae bacterium]|nr:bifunctional oligoribonuclease/PAP phosphatase NrnA [Bacteroidaceae bacterium]
HVIEAAQGAKVMIDHHLNPSGFADLTISEPRMSSTCELLYRVLADLGLAGRMLGKVGATCIFTGMMTDTGNFTYNSSDPEIYEIVAELCRQGIDKESIYNAAMNTNSADQLRLNGYALYDKLKLWTDKHAALITLDKKELQRFNYRKGDTEGLVNKPLTIPDIFWVAFLREDEKYIKVSMRSRGDFDVSKMCNAHFNGGGHKNAAGGEFYGTMEECVALFEHLVNTYTFK